MMLRYLALLGLCCRLLPFVMAGCADADDAASAQGSAGSIGGSTETGGSMAAGGSAAQQAGAGGTADRPDAAALVDASDTPDAGPPPAPSCEFAVSSCAATPAQAWNVLLDAAEFGSGARFVALGGQAVLIAGGSAAFRVARVHDADEVQSSGRPYSVWTFPEADLSGVDVAENMLSAPGARQVFALACSQDDQQCTLLKGDPGGDVLVVLPEASLPSGFEPRGLFFDWAADPAVVCAYGNGVLCFDSEWRQAIAPAQDLQLNDVAVGELWSLAVGNHGRHFKRERNGSGDLGPWIEQPMLADVDLTAASVAGAGAVAIGDGRVQAALGELRATFGCGSPSELRALLAHPFVARYAYAVTSTGAVMQHLPNAGPGEFCMHEQLPAGVVLEANVAPCQDGINPRALMEQAVIGMNICPRT